MRILRYCADILVFTTLMFSCQQKTEPVVKEPWIDKPFGEWPAFSMVNQVQFRDTVFEHLGNAFLLDTGTDTLALTCKHVFLAFKRHLGTNIVDLGDDFLQWQCYALNRKSSRITLDTLINKDVDEEVVPFRQMKIKDWLLFSVKDKDSFYYPLKLRRKPVMKYEVVYAVGWGTEQEDYALPEKTVLQCYDNMGDYFYVRTLSKNTTPNAKSGSPVIDENGYLVGLVSGAEGKLGVIASVDYLIRQLEYYNIPIE